MDFTTFLQQLVSESAFAEDAKTILSLPQTSFNAIAAALEEHKEPLDRETLEAIISHHCPPETDAKAITRPVYWLAISLRSQDDPLDEAGAAFVTAVKENTTLIAKEKDRLRFARRTLTLAQKPKGFDSQVEAVKLTHNTGPSFTSLLLTTDLRPVFADDYSRICAMIPITVVNISASEDDSQKQLMFSATETNLRSMHESLSIALEKIAQLKIFTAASGLTIPNTGAIYTESSKQ